MLFSYAALSFLCHIIFFAWFFGLSPILLRYCLTKKRNMKKRDVFVMITKVSRAVKMANPEDLKGGLCNFVFSLVDKGGRTKNNLNINDYYLFRAILAALNPSTVGRFYRASEHKKRLNLVAEIHRQAAKDQFASLSLLALKVYFQGTRGNIYPIHLKFCTKYPKAVEVANNGKAKKEETPKTAAACQGDT